MAIEPLAIGPLTVDSRGDQSPHHGLTARELEVLTLLARGMSNAEIAGTLFISLRTAQTHVTNILTKLGVSSRTEAAVLAVRDALV